LQVGSGLALAGKTYLPFDARSIRVTHFGDGVLDLDARIGSMNTKSPSSSFKQKLDGAQPRLGNGAG